MLSNNPRPDKFSLQLPKNFFKDEICQKYNRYLDLNNSYFTTIDKIVNESIMRVSIPGLSQQLTSQTTATSDTSANNSNGVELDVTYYAGTQPLEEVQESNDIVITFRHLDSYINYFFLMECFYKFYSRDESDYRFLLPIVCKNVDNHPVFNAIFSKCLFKSINGLDLGYDNQARDFKEFQCTFTYSDFTVEFDLPQGTAKSYKK